MTTIIQRLRIFEYEAEPDWGGHAAREEEGVLDEEGVARLLFGVPGQARPDLGRERAMAIEATDDGDALAAMRGVMIGFAMLIPFWTIVAASILQIRD